MSGESLVEIAFTHSSWAYEHGGEHNERLEFLGDAVLQLCITELLYRRLPEAREGDLSRIRQQLVNTHQLAGLARARGYGARARLGRGEEQSGGRERPKLLAGLYEAALGALHLEEGVEASCQRVQADFADLLDAALDASNPKQRLQEWCQARTREHPVYVDAGAHGPDHQRTWRVDVLIDGRVVATGEGTSKKEASANAAEAAVAALGIDDEAPGEEAEE